MLVARRPTTNPEGTMLDVLLESKAARSRRLGGTLTSTMLHAALVAGAITVAAPKPGPAAASPPDTVIVFNPIPPRPDEPPSRPAGPPGTGLAAAPVRPEMPRIEIDPGAPPSIDVSSAASIEDGEMLGPRIDASSPFAGRGGQLGSPNVVVDEHRVDRAPRLLPGAPEPRFPDALRARGTTGRVVVQFVIDTLGRAEAPGIRVLETTEPAFADAVRAVLPRYRFSPGEAGGRKVRTLVQLPFDFELTRRAP
jgi:protein TonB